MFNPRLFENSRPDGFPVLEIIGTPGPEGGPPEHAPTFVPLRRSDLAGEISGPVAAMVLTQRFGFTSQQSTQPIEAGLPIPPAGRCRRDWRSGPIWRGRDQG